MKSLIPAFAVLAGAGMQALASALDAGAMEIDARIADEHLNVR